MEHSGEYIPYKKDNQLVIAVCGPSTSGKSTTAKQILEKYEKHKDQIEIMTMDHFFDFDNAGKINIYGKDFTDLDSPKSYKWNDFFKSISENNSPILLIDGFILFADKRSKDLFDACIVIEYNIDTDYEIALDRRIHRRPSDKEKIIEKDYLQNPHKKSINQDCTYFHEVVWPEMINHPEYRKPQNWGKPILTLSATNDLQENVTLAYNFIKPLIDSKLK